jgi:hypothetical protein
MLAGALAALLATATIVPAAVLAAPAAPTIAVEFASPTADVGEATALRVTISNPNSTGTLNGISVSVLFSSGLVLATPNGLSGSCGGGAITPLADSVSLTGASLAPGSSCHFSVDVLGQYWSTFDATSDAVTSTESGPGGTASATLRVGYLPTVSATFSPDVVVAGRTTTLSFGLYNPETSSTDLVGVGLVATLPSPLTVVAGSADACNGGTLTAAGNTVTLTNASLPVSWTCGFSVVVNTSGAGSGFSIPVEGVTSANGMTGHSTAATLTTVPALQVAMAFDPASVVVGDHSSLTFSVANSALNPDPLTGVQLGATLAAGLTVQDATSTVCGGTLTVAGGDTIGLTGATIAAGSTCDFSADVTSSAVGSFAAVSTVLSSTEFGQANGASAALGVTQAPAPTPTPTATPTATPTSTPPPTTLEAGPHGPSPADPALPLLLLFGWIAGLVVVRRLLESATNL